MKIHEKNVGVGIIGAGLIGKKRAAAMRTSGRGRLLAVADTDIAKAKELAEEYKCEAYADSRELLRRDDIDVVIIALPIGFSVPVSVAALKYGKHVLCEKPLGRNAKEARIALVAARKYRKVFKVGFNHRFHASLALAKKLFDEKKIGDIMFIRARYGYGGRLGMEKEWRMQKEISGGGELIDQGVHIIDLARWFAGDPDEVYGIADTKFWKTDVDDNAFVTMKHKKATTLFHVSSTNWKNIFSFEVFGTRGYLQVEGKGGSYGKETLVFGKRKEQFGVPDIEVFEFEGDVSWVKEWENFLDGIFRKKRVIGDVRDGYYASVIIDAVYRSSRNGKPVKVSGN